MCYHVKSAPKADLRPFVEKNVGGPVIVEPYPELDFANGFAKPQLPVMLSGQEDRVQPWRWQFQIPGDKVAGLTTLNATCERMFESRLFGDSAKNRRCLVFVKGFYEWSPGEGGKKIPYYIEREDGEVFAMGGIWKDFGEVNGERFQCLSIVTTPANRLLTVLRPEKPRMTYIVDPEHWGQWLDCSRPVDEVKKMITTYRDILTGKEMAVSPLATKPKEKAVKTPDSRTEKNTNTLF